MFVALAALSVTLTPALQTPETIRFVPANHVTLTDTFWKPRLDTMQRVTIDHVLDQCYSTGRIANFEIAAGTKQGDFAGLYFNDSDVYKAIEGAAYILSHSPDPELEKRCDDIIAIIAAAQEDDGYLYTARTVAVRGGKSPVNTERWSNVRDQHELYCMGHLYEAAAAYYKVTGKRALLDVAVKNADLVCSVFRQGGRMDASGHQEVEIGLVRLAEATGNDKYLQQAYFFTERRGNKEGRPFLYGDYAQDHIPLREQDKAVGHAVRAAYMYTGMADIALALPDTGYTSVLDKVWENVASAKLYITGGIGASGSNEGFTFDYDLPNLSAYQETCASIANAFWNDRMFRLHGDGKYVDVLERALYNGFLAGYSLDGTRFFYPNPLGSANGGNRVGWFECACCPPNVARMVPSVPGYFYATKPGTVYVNLYAESQLATKIDGQRLGIKQTTSYPWDGTVTLDVTTQNPRQFDLRLRIPGWARDEAVASDLYTFADQAKPIAVKVNGKTVQAIVESDGYLSLDRLWASGDKVELTLPMDVRRVRSNENVVSNVGRIAFQRGPLVYCAEGVDQADGDVFSKVVGDADSIKVHHQPELLGGVTTLSLPARSSRRTLDGGFDVDRASSTLTLVPYYAWAHRAPGQMNVWFPTAPEHAWAKPAPTIAATSKISGSFAGNFASMVDQLMPANSDDHTYGRYHWWPKKDTTEWLQFDFDGSKRVSSVGVYWFDDAPRNGGCRIPESWHVELLVDGEWKAVASPHAPDGTPGYHAADDILCTVEFDPIEATALRIVVKLQKEWASGVHEVVIK